MFNLLKQTYRKSNVYIPQDLIESIDKQQDITVVDYGQYDFFNWDASFEKYLHKLSATLVNHIFEVSDDNPTTMKTQVCDGKPVKTQQLLKREFIDYDWANNLQLVRLPEPGIQDIKKVELYNKWRLLVPFHKRSLWKYYRDAPDLALRNKVKDHTKESKKQRTERSRTAEFETSSVL